MIASKNMLTIILVSLCFFGCKSRSLNETASLKDSSFISTSQKSKFADFPIGFDPCLDGTDKQNKNLSLTDNACAISFEFPFPTYHAPQDAFDHAKDDFESLALNASIENYDPDYFNNCPQSLDDFTITYSNIVKGRTLPGNLDLREQLGIFSYVCASYIQMNQFLYSGGSLFVPIFKLTSRIGPVPVLGATNYSSVTDWNCEKLDGDGKQNLFRHIALAVSGLRKLTPYKGTVWRGYQSGEIYNDAVGFVNWKYRKSFQDKSLIIEKGFLSTSYVKEAAWPGNVQYEIQSISGVKVEPFAFIQSEREVLFAPGSKFLVTNIIEDQEKNTVYVFLQESISNQYH